MHIGFAYDLRDDYLKEGYSLEVTAEFDRVSTIEGIENALKANGHTMDRIGHARALAARLVKGDRWDLVFSICEGMHGFSREGQASTLCEMYAQPYCFSDPLTLALTLHKGQTKRVVRDAGLPTAPFHVVSSIEDLNTNPLPVPFIAKPLTGGTGQGVSPRSVIRNLADLKPVCEELLATFPLGVILEGFLPGREFTTGIRGTGRDAKVIGTYEVILLGNAEAEVYSYKNKEESEERVTYNPVNASDPVVKEAERIALESYHVLGCQDAGRVDIRCDAVGLPHFLEVNPLAGLHPEHSDLPMIARSFGLSYNDLIGGIIESAKRRIRYNRIVAPPAH